MSIRVLKIAERPLRVKEPSADIVIDGIQPPLIPEGEYTGMYLHHDTKMVFSTPKVFVHFKIMDVGKYFGIELYRVYRAKEVIGKQGRNGKFKLGRRSELYLDICRLYESEMKRPDRISLRPWRNVVLKIAVRTVTNDYKQRPLPESLRYSVIDRIDGIVAGCL